MTTESPVPSRSPIERLDLVLRYGLMLVLLLAPTQAGLQVAGFYLSPVDPLIWLLALIWGLSLMLGGRWRRVRWIPGTAVFFVLAIALSIPRAMSKTDALKDLVQAAEYFLAAGLLFANLFRGRSLRWALGVHLAAALAIVALASAQYLHPGVADFLVRGTFGNRNVLGGYLALCLPLMFAMALFGGFDWRLRLALVAVVVAGLLINLSGGTLLALFIALPFVALCHGRRAALATFAALMVLFLLAVPRMPRNNFLELHASVSVFDADGDLSARYTEWLGALAMWHEQPLLIGGPDWLRVEDEWGSGLSPAGWLIGVGAGNFQRNIGMYYGYLPQVNINVTEPDSHNTYLVLLSTVGLLGVLGFALMLLQSAFRALRLTVTDDRLARGIAVGVAAALAAYAVNALWAGLLVRGIGVPLAFTLILPWLLAQDTEGEVT